MRDIPAPPAGGKQPGGGRFKSGDRVTVVDGTFVGLTGEVIDPGGLARYPIVRVALPIFGRSVPVELEPWQIRHA